MPIIEIRSLSYSYNLDTPYETRALDNVSLSIAKGIFLGLAGANGSGKSTLIQHLNGLLCPQDGSITVLGRDTRDKDYRSRLWQHVGLVFQFPEQQVFEATVFDEIAYGLKNMGLHSDKIQIRAAEALDNVGLSPEFLTSAPLRLSGGMRRRVAVASILAMQPEILVLDEPTAGLDAVGSARIMETIKKYQQEKGTTVIMVSHCLNEISLYSDYLAVLDRGKLRAFGKTREVLACSTGEVYDNLLPDYIKVLFDLKRHGWPINTSMLTVEEAAQEISRVLAGEKA